MVFEDLKHLINMNVGDARSYSGRGMYGKQCLGVTMDKFSDLADLVENCDTVEDAAWIIRNVKTDSMGLSTIFYWPKLTWIDEDETDEGEDDEV